MADVNDKTGTRTGKVTSGFTKVRRLEPHAPKPAGTERPPSFGALREQLRDNPGIQPREKKPDSRGDKEKHSPEGGEYDKIPFEVPNSRNIAELFNNASPQAKKAIEDILVADREGKLKSVKIRLRSIYDDRLPGESVEDFVRRVHPKKPLPLYRDFHSMGILEFLREHYAELGFLDGEWFTRASLRRLDMTAYRGLTNWLHGHKETLPPDLNLPAKPEQGARLVEELTDEEIRAGAAARRRKLTV